LSEQRKYRKFTAQQKTELVLAALKGQRSIAELARERDISETLLRRWREQFLAGGRLPKPQGVGSAPVCSCWTLCSLFGSSPRNCRIVLGTPVVCTPVLTAPPLARWGSITISAT